MELSQNKAREILVNNKVDTCGDHRSAIDIVAGMLEKGYLDPSVLGVSIEELPDTSEKDLMLWRPQD